MKAGFPYALTRLHARVGRRPGSDARKRLRAVGDFGHFLQQAAQVGYAPWLRKLGPGSDVHSVELALRETWRGAIAEVAEWVPARWREAVEWLTLAPDLPVLAELIEHGRRADWMARDPQWARLPTESGDAVLAALRPRWPTLDEHEPHELGEAWCAQAEALRPRLGTRARRVMHELLQAQLGAADPAVLLKRFRRESGAPVRVFAWAGLARFDFAFLRGQLVRRRLEVREAA